MQISSCSFSPIHCPSPKPDVFPLSHSTSKKQLHVHSAHKLAQRSAFWPKLRAICADNDTAPPEEKADAVESASEGLNVTVREARNSTEFEQIGWVRARAYYAVSRTCMSVQ